MYRIATVGALCVIALCACNESNQGPSRYVAPNAAPLMKATADQQNYVYTHLFTLEMARDFIKPRFERAQQHCLHDASLNCTLISSSMTAGDSDYSNSTEAQLVVSLPHSKVEAFENSLLDPLSGESADDVIVRARSTQAQNVTQEAADLDHKIAQLTDYRDRLAAIAKRSDLHADDLIKIEHELSDVEGQLDDAIAQKNDVSQRVRRETVTVSLGERALLSDAWRPIGRTWRSSLETLSESASLALQFAIQILPWLPIIAGMIWLISLLPRIIPKRKVPPAPPPPPASKKD